MKVHLEIFEGPLDLLLHLIKKEDLDIYDIPISRVLVQYLEYINLAKELDIDLAGEFLETASDLIYIKSKLLLPESDPEEDEGPDPRADLVARLLEYQRYKMVAEALIKRPLLGREVFTRVSEVSQEEAGETFIEADSMSLLSAFQDLLKKLPRQQYHEIHDVSLGVSERVVQLLEFLKGKESTAFEDLFEGVITRSDFVVTFLAILEMVKQRMAKILQEQVLNKIFIFPLLIEGGETPED